MEALFSLFWNARPISKLAFIVGFVAIAWLLVRCSDGVEFEQEPPPPRPVRPAVRPDDALHLALETSLSQTLACIAKVRETFSREAIAGLAPGKPPATKPPARVADLKDARVFEVYVEPESAEVTTFEPSSGVPIASLATSGLFRHGERDSICGIDDRMKALVAWSAETATDLLAKLRAEKPVPPLVVAYWRWCDHTLGGPPRPYTCSVGLAWIDQATRAVIASAAGTGHAKLPAKGTPRERDGAAYVAAMEQAEHQLRDTVLAWK